MKDDVAEPTRGCTPNSSRRGPTTRPAAGPRVAGCLHDMETSCRACVGCPSEKTGSRKTGLPEGLQQRDLGAATDRQAASAAAEGAGYAG